MPKIAVAGLIHGHVLGIIDNFSQVDGVELVAVSDRTPLLERSADRFQRTYVEWQEMFAKEEIDALVVTSDNVESAEIAVAALSKGVPCFVEKAMAANVADAERMLAAAESTGAILMINWPFAWTRWMPALKETLDSGEIGHVFHMRYRNGHFGPKEIGCDEWFVGWLYDEVKNGGGAIADFGSYGAVLARTYFGMPESVYCVRHNATKDYFVPDDHAVITLRYPKLTVSIEATWATFGMDSGPNPVVHGAKGTLAIFGDKVEKTQKWGDRSTIELQEHPVKNPAQYFLECIQSNKQPEGVVNMHHSADAVRIIAAAIRSSSSGCAETP
jgi:predicted dehydrogenase